MQVSVQSCSTYDSEAVRAALDPLRSIFSVTIRRGDSVVLKPNWLAHRHKYQPDEWRSLITNPAVISAVLDLVLDCLDGQGRVIITDGPQTDSSWSAIMNRMQPERWIEAGRRRRVEVSLLDLRDHEWQTKGDVNIGRRRLPGDPLGATVCDLGPASEFSGHSPSRHGYYGADYDTAETNEAHRGGRHQYKVSRTVIAADVFVNLPKMKTHKKAGITCSLKNLVGINTYKNWLPHHSEGTPDEGGDQYPAASAKNSLERIATQRFKSLLAKFPGAGTALVPVKALGQTVFGDTQHTIRSGNWYGNDTLWRTVLDLNKVLLYANPDGSLRQDDRTSRKRYITVVDGIIGGEGNGPEAPTPRPCGVILAGTDPVAVDAVCARLMGFNWERIPSICRAFGIRRYSLCDGSYEDIEVSSSDERFNRPLLDISPAHTFAFRPHFGWSGHVELDSTPDRAVLRR